MNSPRLCWALLACSLSGAAPAAPVAGEHVEAELIAENLSFKPGAYENWVALRLAPEAGWHIYWRNPGDSGIPTKLQWELTAGVTTGDIHWRYPHRQSLGDLTNYGYGEETLHLVPVTVAPAAGAKVQLKATAKWLVCKDICIPGEAKVALAVPVSEAEPKADPAWAPSFAAAREALPRAVPDWSARFAVDEGDVSLDVQGAKFPPGSEVEFFPYANDLVAHAAPQRVALDERNGLRLSQKLSPYFVSAPETVEGVLVVHDAGGAKAFEIAAAAGAVEPVPAPTRAEVGPAPDAAAAPHAREEDPTLAGTLLAALLGGLILNLMPCVFPVLAMKALSVLQARGETAADNRRHALAYTAGVIGSFVAVAGVLIALRAAGAALGWGFQLQSPPFVYALVLVIVAIGLSLAGAAQFGASWMGAGQSLASKPGLAGSFFTGVLAVVVASPCTAPFMAGALGFALTQPALVAVAVFVALGLGLAAPFLLIGFVPRLAGFLPKPGAWMATLKEFLAFPMFLTAAWLLYVLGGLTDRTAMAYALVGVVLVAFALWLAGRGQGSIVGRLLAAAALAGAVWIGFQPALQSRPPQAAAESKAGWEPYSDARMAELKSQGRSVFVDFTADWCLTCKVNERTALRSERVVTLFRARNVALLVGDWTRSDPAITAVLARYGRSGVPLYLASSAGAEPVVLPQVLTPSIVEDAFR